MWIAKTALSAGRNKKKEEKKEKEPEFADAGDEAVTKNSDQGNQGVPAEFHLPREGEVGHTGSVIKAAFTPDESFVVTCSKDGSVIMWNLNSGGAKERTFREHRDPVLNVSVNYDGSRFASCDNEGVSGSEKGLRISFYIFSHIPRPLSIWSPPPLPSHFLLTLFLIFSFSFPP